MKTEFNILAERKGEVMNALDKLAKKGRRFKVAPLTVTWGEEFIKNKYYPDGRLDPFTGKPKVMYKIPYQKLTVEGEPPRVAGYEFIGRIEFAEAGTLVQTVPGHTVPEKYWTTNTTCEHCKTKRYRKDVFVVRKESGETMQVGRQCLQDFLGNDPAMVLRTFQHLHDFAVESEEWESWGSGGKYFAYYPLEILTQTATIIRRFGWMSRKAAKAIEEKTGVPPTATVDHLQAGESTDPETRKWFEKEVESQINEGDEKLAKETLEWARGLQHVEGNEYLHNLKIILSAELIHQPRHLALVVSAVSAFLRDKKREDELNMRRKLDAVSEYQGEVGKRLRNVKVKLELAIALPETMWGSSTLYKFRDESGNLYTTMTGTSVEANIGEEVMLTGTVKRHNEYKGVKETQLSRIVLADVPVVQQASML